MTQTVQLPPPSPALTVHQAAATLRRVAECAQTDLATSDYWSGYDKATAWRDGFANGFGGPCSDLVALFPPGFALEFADWLDAVASAAARHGAPLPTLALTAAQKINGGAR
ncbi:hypothetical protein ABT186_01775 [Streptomyces sp. NPDC001634]|uniref:hypothetical protein n=1 Tax=Streptomyces sp. NPDC001634 TaxID=3154390 RepID=UPI003326222B